MSGTDFRTFVEQVAALTKDGEPSEDGTEFEMMDDDAYDTLHLLITAARELLGLPHRTEATAEWAARIAGELLNQDDRR